ncbi:hypothetical protein M3Y94_00231300 [Aphelenchoides besseyi]|nr:hypothetical protein M3Y94_00231300 [Aphelenchoides besseyi]KAI6236437.1 hypothetical protein M3Y95_00157500 [Aphelenchoides besseyi]
MAPVTKKPKSNSAANKPKDAVQKSNPKRRNRRQLTDDQEPSERQYVSAYKRAQQTFNRIQEERQQQAEAKQQEREEKARKLEENLSLRRKMNKALKKRTKKGQPKLGAQMDVLLEKLERRLANESK